MGICEIELKEDFYRRVLNSDNIVVAVFYAPYIGEALYFKKIIKKLVDESIIGFETYFINGDNFCDLADEFLVSCFPSILFVKNGDVILRIEGVISEDLMIKAVENIQKMHCS